MKTDTRCPERFAVLMLILACLAVQAVFTLPAYGDKIVGWGSNDSSMATPPKGYDFIAIDAGGYHSLALKADGSLVAWGWDEDGWTRPPAGNDFTAIAAGGQHGLALKAGGSIVGWGWNGWGQASPPAGNDFTAIAAGGEFSLALKADHSIVGWGWNNHGQLTLPTGNDFKAIAAGSYHGLALKSDGSIVGWGYNYYGQATPPAGNDFTAIAAGSYHSLALKSNGSIVAWGGAWRDQLLVPEGNDFVAIAAGAYHGLALKSDGSIAGWGWNPFGQATPPTGNDFTAVAASAQHSLALVYVPPDATPPEISIVAPQPYGLYAVGNLALDFSAYDLLSGPIVPPDLLGTLADAQSWWSVEPGYVPSAGVYTLTVSAIDWGGNVADPESVMFVVYDPEGGFVTGGGWIWSPPGAYADDLSLEGKASFGFVSKYNKGVQVPTGNTEFVFEAGDLNFHSGSYDWLVVNQGGANAQFKGTGTINGAGEYKFMLWAKDGDYDTLRIKIWQDDEESAIYDNGFDQPISGGSIVIHPR